MLTDLHLTVIFYHLHFPKRKKNKKEKEEKENTACPLYSFVYLHTVKVLCSQGRSGSQTDISHEHLDYTD